MCRLYNIRACFAIGLIAAAGVLSAAGLALPNVAGENPPLEPSIQNEVDHAIYLGEKWLENFVKTNKTFALCGMAATNGVPTNCVIARCCWTNRVPAGCCSTNCVRKAACMRYACGTADLFATNSLDRGQIALKLVRSQRGGGFWLDPRDASVTNRVPEFFATRLAVSILNSL